MKFVSVLLFLCATLFAIASSKRVIVKLSEPPAARNPMFAAMRRRSVADRRRSLESFSVAAVNQQDTFINTQLPSQFKVTQILTESGLKPARFSTLINAISVEVGDDPDEIAQAISTIKKLPGVVSVSQEQKYTPSLYSSRETMGAIEAWNELGDGIKDAGKGIKVAVVDTGIYTKHAMFDDTGMEYPTDGDYPMGEIENCNKKVIVSRFYINPDNLPIASDNHSYPSIKTSSHAIQ